MDLIQTTNQQLLQHLQTIDTTLLLSSICGKKIIITIASKNTTLLSLQQLIVCVSLLYLLIVSIFC
jgi:hypothetical protein